MISKTEQTIMKSDILERKNNLSVVQYLNQIQNTVTRLSTHGMQCRIWTVGLVCSITTVIKGIGLHEISKSTEICLCVIPFVMLCFLNAYYYGLEKQLFEWRIFFVNQIENEVDDAYINEIYHDPIAKGLDFVNFCRALISPSISCFYLFFILLVVLTLLL